MDDAPDPVWRFIALAYLVGAPGILVLFVVRGLVREAIKDVRGWRARRAERRRGFEVLRR